MIEALHNVVQPYAWGSRTALAELRGEASPSATPQAELWVGAHPNGHSRLERTGECLGDAIHREPEVHLGSRTRAHFGDTLPFLLKLLAAECPLSLQAHPSLARAAEGFEEEDARGIELGAPHRNYKDRNHKPEILCALGPFWALSGFRERTATLALFDELAVPELEPLLAPLRRSRGPATLREAFSHMMRAPRDAQRIWAEKTTSACRNRLQRGSDFEEELRWAVRVGELHAGDIGVVSSLFLNLVELRAGEALYLPAGSLHAYLEGTGVELMASSDNVLRGGLTPKHVDVDELLRVLVFDEGPLHPLIAEADGQEFVYRTPAPDFTLSRLELDGSPIHRTVFGPELWFATAGEVELRGEQGPAAVLRPGRSAFVSASAERLAVSGHGRVFRATVGPAVFTSAVMR